MWSKKLLITLVVITAVSSQSVAQIQLQVTSEFRENDTVQKLQPPTLENNTNWFPNSPNSSQIQFQGNNNFQENGTVQKLHPYIMKNITKWSINSSNSSQIMMEVILANSMKNFLPLSYVNENCVKDGQQYITGLNNQMRWAIQMYESSAKYPSNAMELGNFDLCMRSSSEPLGIHGAYALTRIQLRGISDDVTLKLPGPDGRVQPEGITMTADERLKAPEHSTTLPVGSIDMQWALCIPDSCSGQDVETSVRHAITTYLQRTDNVSIQVTVPPPMYTSGRTAMPVTGGVRSVWAIFVFGLVLVMACTVYDWRKKPENQTIFSNTICKFSVTRNLKEMVKYSKSENLAMVNIIKTIGPITVIMAHRIGLNMALPFINPDPDKLYSSPWVTILFKNPVALEIFFILSGFLTYLEIEKRLRNEKPFNFILILSYRILRIIPTYISAILIFGFILPYLGDGPLWKLIIYSEAEYCRKNWWTNLLFINNYVNSDEMCIISSWYLACDMHFFIVGVILTYMVCRWKNIGIGVFGSLFLTSIYIPAKYIYDNKQLGLLMFSISNAKNPRTIEHMQRIYIKSHFRITTYLIGLAAAYVYLQIKNSNLKISVKSRTIGFIISALLQMACLIVTCYFYIPDQTYNPWHHVFYFTFQRIIFSLTVSYLLVVGVISNFGYINKLFECKCIVAFSRMSYVVYLLQLIVQFQSIGQVRQLYYENSLTLFWCVITDIITTLCYSLLINLIVEAPARKIFKHLIQVIEELKKPESNVQPVTKEETINTVRMQLHETIPEETGPARPKIVL